MTPTHFTDGANCGTDRLRIPKWLALPILRIGIPWTHARPVALAHTGNYLK